MENIPHNDNNWVLYNRTARDYNGNPKSLKGWIKTPCLAKMHGYNFAEIPELLRPLSGTSSPRDMDVNSK